MLHNLRLATAAAAFVCQLPERCARSVNCVTRPPCRVWWRCCCCGDCAEAPPVADVTVRIRANHPPPHNSPDLRIGFGAQKRGKVVAFGFDEYLLSSNNHPPTSTVHEFANYTASIRFTRPLSVHQAQHNGNRNVRTRKTQPNVKRIKDYLHRRIGIRHLNWPQHIRACFLCGSLVLLLLLMPLYAAAHGTQHASTRQLGD